MTHDDIWYGGHPLSLPLLPLAWLYCAVARVRRLAYRRGWLAVPTLAAPVVVVGNLTVGGTGKTPLVIWIARRLAAAGRRPGVLTRGYGGAARDWPRLVTAASDPREVGDEPVLIARRAGCPVAAAPDRVAAAHRLIGEGCDVLVADDGLQHYRLRRGLEILVLDGVRGLGNRRCLPAGPLREPARRARGVDLTVCTGGPCPGGVVMTLVPGPLTALDGGARLDLATLRGQRVTAVAGIGNPRRFFATLGAAGLDLDPRPYPDHHRYTAADVASWPPGPLIMTEKDAVKCAPFAAPNHWYLPVTASLPAGPAEALLARIVALDP